MPDRKHFAARPAKSHFHPVKPGVSSPSGYSQNAPAPAGAKFAVDI
jgi:hypothetical protein